MNDLAVVELQGSEAELLAKIKPKRLRVWDFDKREYKFEDNPEKIKDNELHAAKFADGIRELFAVGRDFKKNVGRFALALNKVYCNVGYIEDFSPEPMTYKVDGVTYTEQFYTDNGFKYITELLDISKSTAYRYKDLARFADEETGEFKDEYKDYSISLLSEILAFSNWFTPYSTYEDLPKLIKNIPSATTIDEIREYRKVIELFRVWKPPFDSGVSRNDFFKNSDIYNLTLHETLDKYHEWQQKQAIKELEDKLSDKPEKLTDLSAVGVSSAVTSETAQPAAREVLVSETELQKYKTLALEQDAQITELKTTIYNMKKKFVENLDECGDCKFNGVKSQKCWCCRRNGKLKDLYEKAQ